MKTFATLQVIDSKGVKRHAVAIDVDRIERIEVDRVENSTEHGTIAATVFYLVGGESIFSFVPVSGTDPLGALCEIEGFVREMVRNEAAMTAAKVEEFTVARRRATESLHEVYGKVFGKPTTRLSTFDKEERGRAACCDSGFTVSHLDGESVWECDCGESSIAFKTGSR